MDTFVIGNMAWNAGLVGVVAYLGKRWMDRTDKRLDNLIEKVSVQNGNMAKVTEEVHIQVALCKARNEDRPKNERCDD
jgi:membrane protein implicated in regulation of membrane protease activity